MTGEEENIGRLITRYLRGELDAAGEEALREWRDDGNEELFRWLVDAARAGENLRRFVYTDEEQEREWQAIRRRVARRESIARRRRVASVAAAVVVLLVVAGGIGYHVTTRHAPVSPVVESARASHSPVLLLPGGERVDLGKEGTASTLARVHPGLTASDGSLTYSDAGEGAAGNHTLKVPRGGEYVLILPDNTTVYLNAESELTYPVAFPAAPREVYLTGEAYFSVRRDESRPFIVHAGPARVEVLGTTFGVRAYDDEPTVQAVLESGSVRFHAGDRALLLSPNTRALYDKDNAALELLPAVPARYLGWKEGRFVYDNAPLEEILRDMSRWYPVDIVFLREAARVLPFSLNIKRHGDVRDVLELLEETRTARFEYRDNTIFIR
jgi:ferric-dicitrate binding protein FerR (iron transport regulator)